MWLHGEKAGLQTASEKTKVDNVFEFQFYDSRVVRLLRIFMENATKATFMLTCDFCCVTAIAAAVVATAGDILTL